LVTRGIGSQRVNRAANIVKRAGIAAASLVGAAISNAPHGYPLFRKLSPEVPQLLTPGGRHTPTSAVNQHRQRMRPVSGG
jgi:hypothetical protein